MNFKGRLSFRDAAINMPTEYYDSGTNLNYRVLDKKQVTGGMAILLACLLDANGPVSGYDVIQCRGNRFPDSEDWGTYGWSWLSEEKAREQYNSIQAIDLDSTQPQPLKTAKLQRKYSEAHLEALRVGREAWLAKINSKKALKKISDKNDK
jgi:hypothetical protein